MFKDLKELPLEQEAGNNKNISVRIVGTGSFLPETSHTTEEIYEIFQACKDKDKEAGKFKDLEWVKKGIGIQATRWFSDINPQRGIPLEPQKNDFELALPAVELALKDAGWAGEEIDQLIFVTCTEPIDVFSGLATRLQKHIGMKDGTRAESVHSGCGGSMLALEIAHQRIASGSAKKILIVATNDKSRHFYRDAYMRAGAWLSHMVFSDGAAAWAVGEADENSEDRVITHTAFTACEELMNISTIGKNGSTIYLYYIKGREVAEAYQKYMVQVLKKLQEQDSFTWGDIKYFIPHQVNLRVLYLFLQSIGMTDLGKVQINVDKIGNTAATCTMILYDQLRRSGNLKEGDKTVISAMGAGLHAGGCIIQH